MARIAYVSKSAQTASESSSASVTLPNGIEIGDLLIMQIAGRPIGSAGSNDTVSVDNSWSLVSSSSVRYEVGTADLRTELWYKVADSTEVGASPDSPTVTVGSNWQGTTAGWSAQILCFSGVDTSSPFDATAVTSSNAAAATFQPTGITTATANAVVLSFVATADDNALNFNTANGYAILYSGASYDTTSGDDHAVACAMQEFTSSGAKTCPTWNESAVGNDAWAAVTIALKPASTTWAHEETWCRTDGSGFGPVSSWTDVLETGATATTQGARGRLTCGTVSGYGGYGYSYIDTGQADYVELRVRYEVSTTSEHYVRLLWRDNGGSGSYYWLQISYGTFCQIDAAYNVSFGGEVAIISADTSAVGALAVGDVVHIYLSHVGSALKIGAWKNNAAESQTNLFNGTENHVTGAGVTTLGVLGGSASANRTVDFAALRISESSGTNASAEKPSATATANNATASVKPAAGSASATATANSASTSVKPSAGNASATATAYNATTTASGNASPTTASAAATAYDAAASVKPAPATASATASGLDASASGTESFTGTSAVTLAAFTSSASGTESFTGTSANTLADFTGSATGTMAQNATGTAAVTLADFTSSATGTAPLTQDTVSHDVRTGQPDPRWRDRRRATWPPPLKTRGNHYGRY